MAWFKPFKKAWSMVEDEIGGVAESIGAIGKEALDVTGAVVTGNWGAIPGEVGEVIGVTAQEIGLVDDEEDDGPYSDFDDIDAEASYARSVAQGGVVADYVNAQAAAVPVAASTSTEGIPMAAVGSTNGFVVGKTYRVDPRTGKLVVRRARRRRRRLLTASDKSDLGYLVGVLGSGQLGKAAITSLLSRRV